MSKQLDKRLAKAVTKFAADYEKVVAEVYGIDNKSMALAEDAETYYSIDDIKVLKTMIKWTETYTAIPKDITYNNSESDEDEIREWLKKWRADMRRARRYWGMDCDTLDKIADGEIEDKGEED